MRFEQPVLLNFLWLLIPLGMFFWWALQRYRSCLARFSEEKFLPQIAQAVDARRHIWKAALLMAVFGFAVLALARPQWGFEWQEVKRQGMDIFIVVDTSKSMLTQDVRPNRLERAKLAIEDFLTRLQGDRVGLIAFAGDAFYMCPLTVDYNGFLLSLNDLSVDSVPRGGTNLEFAIQEALKGYDDTPNEFKAIIIITDGDSTEGEPLQAAQRAKDMGVKIYTIGVGTREGEMIQISNEAGQIEFLKDQEGNFVKSRLNEKLLQQIALTTDGIYVKSGGVNFGLDLIYDQELASRSRREIQSRMEKKYYERFQFPLAAALLLLVIETFVTTRKPKA